MGVSENYPEQMHLNREDSDELLDFGVPHFQTTNLYVAGQMDEMLQKVMPKGSKGVSHA